MAARDQFMSHLTVVKSAMKEGVEILRKLRQVHGKIEFDLPPFATDIDFEVCVKVVFLLERRGHKEKLNYFNIFLCFNALI